MKSKISITIDEKLLRILDKRRGRVKRSTFIENILMDKIEGK